LLKDNHPDLETRNHFFRYEKQISSLSHLPWASNLSSNFWAKHFIQIFCQKMLQPCSRNKRP